MGKKYLRLDRRVLVCPNNRASEGLLNFIFFHKNKACPWVNKSTTLLNVFKKFKIVIGRDLGDNPYSMKTPFFMMYNIFNDSTFI